MFPYLAIGFTSLMGQALCVRALMTVFSGNELEIAITLGAWLLFVGAGSMLGVLIRWRHALAATFIAAAVLYMAILPVIGRIPMALGMAAGEAIPLWAVFVSTGAVLALPCLALGMQFPLAVRHYRKSRDGSNPAASVYALETAGAFAAGIVFPFALAGRAGALAVMTALAALMVLSAAMVTGKRMAYALVLLPLVAFPAVRMLDPATLEGAPIVKRAEGRYGAITVTRYGGQSNVFVSGRYAYSYPDREREEYAAHMAMVTHPNAKNVLALGGSPGVIREYMKYPGVSVDFVETDPALLGVSVSLLGGEDAEAARSRRVTLVGCDGRSYIKSIDEPRYDLIVMSLPPPATALLNRFYTREFFAEARAAMRAGGVLVVSLPSSAGYISRRMREANGAVYATLKSAFTHVETTTEEHMRLIASDAPIDAGPDLLVARYSASGIASTVFAPSMIRDAFDPARRSIVGASLASAGGVNTDQRPMAYYHSLMLWAEAHGGGLAARALANPGALIAVFASALLIAAFLSAGGASAARGFSVFTAGWAAMGITLGLTLGFQARYGYVYEMFALLSAFFMLGGALGSWLMRGRGGLGSLAILEASTALFALAAAWAAASMSEPVFYIMSMAAGALTGAVFSSAASAHSSAGRLYGYELAGSFIGAVMAGVLIVPIYGVGAAFAITAGVKAASGVSATVARRRQR